MRIKQLIFLLFALMAIFYGCDSQPDSGCKPVLFPYIEYNYKAEPQKLAGSYVQKDEEIIDFHGMKLTVPQGWRHETVFAGRTIKFSKGKDHFFLLSFHPAKTWTDDTKNFNFIGCDRFVSNEKVTTRTDKDFWTDLYLFTKDQLSGEPTFWQYSILWSKTEFLRDAIKLIHYTGSNLEAFQRNIKPKSCECETIRTHIEIFPKKIAPHYLTIIAGADDAFFAAFLDMLDTLNP